MELEKILHEIVPADTAAYASCIELFDNIAKPIGSLGKLETLLASAAAASGKAIPDISRKCVLVFCADNGVIAQGVAQSGHEVTTAIARSMLRQTTSVCAMAKSAHADVFAFDMGMVESVDGMESFSLGRGTEDMTRGAAMTRAQCVRAIETGAELVRRYKQAGYGLIAVGEAGIGNTTTSAAVLSVLLDAPPEAVTGRGSGLNDDGLRCKLRAIKRAIAVNSPERGDVIDVLSKLGGFDIAAMCGAFIGGACCHVPVIADGLISCTAALCAVRLCENVRGYILPSHMTAEPAGVLLMRELGFSPILNADMRLGEGTGAVALMPLLDMAVSVLHNAASFENISVEKYEKWN